MAGENLCLDSSFLISKDTFNTVLLKKASRWMETLGSAQQMQWNVHSSLEETTVGEGPGGTEVGTRNAQIYHCSCTGGYEIGERPRQLGKQFSCGSRHHTSANVSSTDRHRAQLKEDHLFSLANTMFGHMTHYGSSARAGYNKDDTCTSLPFQQFTRVFLQNLPCPGRLFGDLWRHFCFKDWRVAPGAGQECWTSFTML